MRVKAKRGGWRYDGKPIEVGQEFSTKSDRDAMLLIAAGKVVDAEKAEAKEAVTAKRRGRPPKSEPVAAPVAMPVDPTVPPGPVIDATGISSTERELPSAYETRDTSAQSDEDDAEKSGDRLYDRRDLQARGGY